MYPYLLSIFSGLALAASFPSTDWNCLAWAGLIPFFIAVEGKGWRETFRIGYVGGAAFYWSLLYWLNNVTVAGFLVLTLYLAVYFPLFGILMNFARRRVPAPWWLVAPVVWTALEYARTYAFTGLPWGVMGATQHRAIPLIQFAAVTGVYGVSFLVVLVNAALYDCAAGRGMGRAVPAVGAALAVAGALVYGEWWMRDGAALGGSVRVAIVQGNVPQEEKFGEGFTREIIGKFHRLTRQVKAERPDLVVWPETSVPGYYWYDPLVRGTTAELQQEMRTPLLLGSVHVSDLDNPNYYNCAFLVDAGGEPLGRYDKIHLVLFGEIIPCKTIFPFLKYVVPFEEDFTPGSEFTVFPLAQGDFAALICFEDVLPDLARNFVKRGARFLVNITNDAWFGMTSQPYQQAAHAVFRCVENCVSMVRATNTGVSCYIDPFGRV
ncbi:MAG: apolipoprotein N-acyltransferase, partial [Planctomycetota bacterium]